MKLNKLEMLIKNAYPQIEFNTEYEEDKVLISANIKIDELYDDDIAIDFLVNTDGQCFMYLTFDQLEPTFEALTLVNKFNSNANSLFHAFIDDENYLVFNSMLIVKNEKGAFGLFNMYLDELFDEDFIEHIKPLTVITK